MSPRAAKSAARTPRHDDGNEEAHLRLADEAPNQNTGAWSEVINESDAFEYYTVDNA